MGTGRSTKDNLQHVGETQKLSAALRKVLPGTREYAVLLLSGVKKRYPRGYGFIVDKEGLTEESLVNIYVDQNYLFMIWLKMMMWYEEYMPHAAGDAKEST